MELAIYLRVATEDPERLHALDRQEAILRAWARRAGHHLAEGRVYLDRSVSGLQFDRPALGRLRADARDGRIDLVAIVTPDRLARAPADLTLVLDELRRAGCDVVFVHQPGSDNPNE
jgi:site-specific DNA recombinase